MPHTTWILYLTVALVPLARASTAVPDQVVTSDLPASAKVSQSSWIRFATPNENGSDVQGVGSPVYSWLGSIWEGSSDSSAKRDADEEKKVWTRRNGASQEAEQTEKTERTTVPSANHTHHRQPDRRPVFLPKSISILENLVHPEEEVQDEVHDAEIFRAVVTSLAEWNLQKILRRKEQRRHRRDEDIDYTNIQQPSPSEEINTRFLLYTRRNPDVPHIMTNNNANSIRTSPYNSSLPSKIVIHGFGGSCHRIWAKQMRKTLINVEDVNVICVDWENGASLPNYKRAADNTRLVGRDVGSLIAQLNNATGSKNSDFHLIGFSLGAHVAGFAGSEVRNQTQSLVSRITGLDPAGPLFENDDPQDRLDSGDAELVDVIHSNGEKIYMGGLGAWAPMGDIDFYPNGGRMQKGCTNLFVGAFTDMIWSSAEENGRSLCNHRRAYKFFTDSVASGCHFPAFACESYEKLLEGDCFPCVNNQCASMGYYADKSPGRGIMYLATREEEPFCANQYRVQLESTARPQAITSLGKIELVLIGTNGFNFTEAFTLTKGPDYELVSGGKLVRLIVPHPNFSPPTVAHLTYTAYHGWLSSGLPEWSIDKLMMTDSFGTVISYCLKGTVLKSGKPLLITLQPGDCNTARAPILSNVLPRQPFDSTIQAMDNEIPILELPRSASIRSLENATLTAIFSNSSATSDAVSPPNVLPPNSGPNSGAAAPLLLAARSNVTNIFPYGNVPLSLLQQQIPADIKVANRRPSFYQWPFVGASHAANFLFGHHGNQVRARLRSLGGSRKQEPHLQLTPPSLQNSVATKDSPAAPPVPRRPYFRRNNAQQPNIDDQNRAQYFLMRQQQLHLQQQQQLQQARQQPAAVNPSAPGGFSSLQSNSGIQLGPLAGGALPQHVMHLPNGPNNQRGFAAHPNSFQWRQESGSSNNPATRYPLTPVLKTDSTIPMPLDHMQQTFAQTLLQNNQQVAESVAAVRTQPQLPISTTSTGTQHMNPVIIVASTIPFGTDDFATGSTPTLSTIYSSSSSLAVPSGVSSTTTAATVTTMTILNTPQHSVSSSTVAPSDVVESASTRTVPKSAATAEAVDGELLESESIQTALASSKGVAAEVEAAEAAALLATKSPGNREVTTSIPSVPSIVLKPPPVEDKLTFNVPVEDFASAATDSVASLNATLAAAADSNAAKSGEVAELVPPNPSVATAPWTFFADSERAEIPPYVRYVFAPSGDSGLGGLLPDELYPNPQQLGQARDQYWATSRGRRVNSPAVTLYPIIQQFLAQPAPSPALQPEPPFSGGATSAIPGSKWEDVKPRYIPLNPVDRQNRQLRMQYYVDTSNKPAELFTTTSASVL